MLGPDLPVCTPMLSQIGTVNFKDLTIPGGAVRPIISTVLNFQLGIAIDQNTASRRSPPQVRTLPYLKAQPSTQMGDSSLPSVPPTINRNMHPTCTLNLLNQTVDHQAPHQATPHSGSTHLRCIIHPHVNQRSRKKSLAWDLWGGKMTEGPSFGRQSPK